MLKMGDRETLIKHWANSWASNLILVSSSSNDRNNSPYPWNIPWGLNNNMYSEQWLIDLGQLSTFIAIENCSQKKESITETGCFPRERRAGKRSQERVEREETWNLGKISIPHLLCFPDTVLFAKRFVGAPHQTCLPAAFFLKHLFTLCFCVTFDNSCTISKIFIIPIFDL